MKRFYWIALLGGVGIIYPGILMAGVSPINYLDLPTLFITLGLALTITLAFYSPGEIRAAFRAAKEKSEASLMEVKQGIVFFTALQKLIVAASILGFLIGAVIMLLNTNDAGPSAGPNISMNPKSFKRHIEWIHYDYQKKLVKEAYVLKKERYHLRKDLSLEQIRQLRFFYPMRFFFRGWACAILTFFYTAFFLIIFILPFKYALIKRQKSLE